VELLVVLGLIALLLSLLLPSLASARRSARAVTCMSNVRQLCVATAAYAADHKGKYPPTLSSPSPAVYWHHPQRVGGYLAPGTTAAWAKPSEVMACPEDADAWISYSFNVWMSSSAGPEITNQVPMTGRLWGSGPMPSSKVILFAEAWSGILNSGGGWVSWPYVGAVGLPGERFGGGLGIQPPLNASRWGHVNSELDFSRHRTAGGNRAVDGTLHVGYVDGHVERKQRGELVNPLTGKSTLEVLWSPLDSDQERD
jgi:prepilin-type processing-associated H-X9-DG protein